MRFFNRSVMFYIWDLLSGFEWILIDNILAHNPLPYEKSNTFLFFIYKLEVSKLIKHEYKEPV
jgi:hypothetical protein